MEENRKTNLDKAIVECYCCYTKYKLQEIAKISATTSGKYADGTNAELRFVCRNCNQLGANHGR